MLTYQRRHSGFTLIEIILGIIVLATALVVITGVLAPLYKQSAEPWQQVRAAELGQSLLNEIMARSFDENSDRAGGQFRCGENSTSCTSCTALGPESELRAAFDDVDDFHGLTLSGSDIVGSSAALALTSLYLGYNASIAVNCAELNGSSSTAATAPLKRIVVTVTTPNGVPIQFSAYRGNW
ncbi:type II secretion system protein [Rheinheimera sp.]|uniref:type IV pilus modification PilV family protein n=1 Tax=Rheinheimera sp. TaxID=1869214 RepID=UPI00307D8A3F